MAQPTTSAEIREAYLSFFEDKEHLRLPSDSLVPSNDPSLLFTVAGMVQFKEEFLGKGRQELRRVTTSQKCIRVPDLENVGKTPRHHTFFEMLGNFSFGDYFKQETIPWEWEFFTEKLGWDGDRLVVTVYQDDDEAFEIWRSVVGLPAEKIYRFGEKENFWPAEAPTKGPNGPCGPCSEIYFDQQPGGPLPPQAGLEELPDRFLEVGNFVFTQFDRRGEKDLAPLPRKNIDVGLGLERLIAVAQNASNNFETDLFEPILDQIQELCDKKYGKDPKDDIRMRRVADHARAVFFCIADGAAPGRDGRGYVVRKILRRAVRDGMELGLNKPFLTRLLPSVQSVMGKAYPQLHEQAGPIQALVLGEEEQFRDVYRHGIARLETLLTELDTGQRVFPGAMAFELHDTYGFPSDITEVIVRERGLKFDRAGMDQAMAEQRERARSGSAMTEDLFAESSASVLQGARVHPTDFVGYEKDECQTEVVAILQNGSLVEAVDPDATVQVVLRQTPFYAEGGGQVGDRGWLTHPEGTNLFEVQKTSSEEGFWIHEGVVLQAFVSGTTVQARIDSEARRSTEAHHTATHLLHAALKNVVGDHVNQAGSLVAPDRLRFDYTHPEALDTEQIEAIEDQVNRQTLASKQVEKRLSSLTQAKADGVIALFGEKYGDQVRVVEIPDYSMELCGGTHVGNTGAIGPLRILSERALAAGVRRMEAVAGQAALHKFRAEQKQIVDLEKLLKAPADRLAERIVALKEDLKKAKSAKKQQAPAAGAVAKQLREQSHDAALTAGSFGWLKLSGVDAAGLRAVSDGLGKEQQLPDLILLIGGDDRSVPFLFLNQPQTTGFKAGDLAKSFGKHVSGGGGGRPDFAQGQGKNGENLQQKVDAWLADL